MALRSRVQGHDHTHQHHHPSHHHHHYHHKYNPKRLHYSRRYEEVFLLLALLLPANFLDISEATYSYDPGPEFEPAPGGLNVTTFTGQTSRLPCSVKHLNGKTVSWIRGRDLQVLSSDRRTFATDIRISVLPGPSHKSAIDRPWKPPSKTPEKDKMMSFKGDRHRRSLVEFQADDLTSTRYRPEEGYAGGAVEMAPRKELLSNVDHNTSDVITPCHRSVISGSEAGVDRFPSWRSAHQLHSLGTIAVTGRIKRPPANGQRIFDRFKSKSSGFIHPHHHRHPNRHHLYRSQHSYDPHYQNAHQYHHYHHYHHNHHRHHHHEQRLEYKTHYLHHHYLFGENTSRRNMGCGGNYSNHDHQNLLTLTRHHRRHRHGRHLSHFDDVASVSRNVEEEPFGGRDLVPLPRSHLLDSEKKLFPSIAIFHHKTFLQTPSPSPLPSLSPSSSSSSSSSPASPPPSSSFSSFSSSSSSSSSPRAFSEDNEIIPTSGPTEKVNSHSKRSSSSYSSSKQSFSSSSSNSLHSGSSHSNSNDLTLDWRADDFTLQIRYTEPGDAGKYICQVNTEPSMAQVVTLNVIDMEAEIVGKQELYVKAGTPVVLKCRVRHGDLMPGFIFWYKGKRLVDYASTGGRVQVLTSPDGQSQLVLKSAVPSDSANYTCYPPGGTSASVQLGVIVDERPAAMQQGNGGSSTTLTTAATTTTATAAAAAPATASSVLVLPSLPSAATSLTLIVSSLLTKCDLLDLQLWKTFQRLAFSTGASMILLILHNCSRGIAFLLSLGVVAVVVELFRRLHPWNEETGGGKSTNTTNFPSFSRPLSTSSCPSCFSTCSPIFSFSHTPFHSLLSYLPPSSSCRTLYPSSHPFCSPICFSSKYFLSHSSPSYLPPSSSSCCTLNPCFSPSPFHPTSYFLLYMPFSTLPSSFSLYLSPSLSSPSSWFLLATSASATGAHVMRRKPFSCSCCCCYSEEEERRSISRGRNSGAKDTSDVQGSPNGSPGVSQPEKVQLVSTLDVQRRNGGLDPQSNRQSDRSMLRGVEEQEEWLQPRDPKEGYILFFRLNGGSIVRQSSVTGDSEGHPAARMGSLKHNRQIRTLLVDWEATAHSKGRGMRKPGFLNNTQRQRRSPPSFLAESSR